MEPRCTCGDLCWRALCASWMWQGSVACTLLTSWGRPKVSSGGGAGGNSSWEVPPELVGGSRGFLEIQSRMTSSSEVPDPYRNKGQSQQSRMDAPALIDFHPDNAGGVLIENLSPFPGPPSVLGQPGPSALCRRPLQETGGQRTMPALGLSLQSWACTLHQRELS